MKRIAFLSIGVLCLAIAGSASAVLPRVGYIGIFADTGHTVNSVCPPQNGQFQAWIWCLPSENGLQAVDFAVRFPATVATLNIVTNPAIILWIGSLPYGITCVFDLDYCQTNWVWTHCITMTLVAALPSTIDIIPDPGVEPVPAYQFASCGTDYPLEPCINLTPLYLCYSGPLGVQETNWGAIKALYR